MAQKPDRFFQEHRMISCRGSSFHYLCLDFDYNFGLLLVTIEELFSPLRPSGPETIFLLSSIPFCVNNLN